MNFGEAFGGLVPGARGAVLAALLRTGAPLTGRRVHQVVVGGHSLGSVQQALRDLEGIGLVVSEPLGRAKVHRLNEDHVAVPHLRALASPLDLLRAVVEDNSSGAESVILFGSVARGEAHRESDIDLAVIAHEAWGGRVRLQDEVERRLGNHADVLHLTKTQVLAPAQHREPVVAEILRDGLALVGSVPRRGRVVS